MNSRLTKQFIKDFERLPEHVKHSARRNYRLWVDNPQHPSLQFKKVKSDLDVYSIRVGLGWRALGVKHEHEIVWFWIGSHADYDRLVRQS